jgi:hypothetical protein
MRGISFCAFTEITIKMAMIWIGAKTKMAKEAEG